MCRNSAIYLGSLPASDTVQSKVVISLVLFQSMMLLSLCVGICVGVLVLRGSFWYYSHLAEDETIRIHHDCEGEIGKSVLKITGITRLAER